MKVVIVAPVHIYDDVRVFRKEAVTLEAPPPPAMGVKAGSGLVAKDEKLEKQMTSQMSRVRYRR